jgi:hypothetical protein
MLLACGLRRHEVTALRLDHLQQREERWNLAPLNLRRTCARLCHASGGELEQIQSLLLAVPASHFRRRSLRSLWITEAYSSIRQSTIARAKTRRKMDPKIAFFVKTLRTRLQKISNLFATSSTLFVFKD